jgi:hypothetical protein
MQTNLNERSRGEKTSQKKESILPFNPKNFIGDQNKDEISDYVIENYVQINNHEILLKQKANHITIETLKVNRNSFLAENDDSKINLCKKFEGLLLNFLEYSTIGGLSELGKREELYLRLFWAVVVFICSSYTLVTFIETVNRFYNYEVNLVFDKYQDIPTKFPAITICNQNPFNERYALKYLQDKYLFTRDYGYYNPINSELIEKVEEYEFYFSISDKIVNNKYQTINQLKRTLTNDLNQTELLNIGYDLDTDMLISCQYNGNSCSETNGDFKKFWNNIYGNCYTFNSGNNSYLTGDQNGLHLEMIVSM